MDRHPPWRAMLPLAHLQRELRDLPTRHAGFPRLTATPAVSLGFSLELFLDQSWWLGTRLG